MGLQEACTNIQHNSTDAATAASSGNEAEKSGKIRAVADALAKAEEVLDKVWPEFENYYDGAKLGREDKE